MYDLEESSSSQVANGELSATQKWHCSLHLVTDEMPTALLSENQTIKKQVRKEDSSKMFSAITRTLCGILHQRVRVIALSLLLSPCAGRPSTAAPSNFLFGTLHSQLPPPSH
jgi:hypothetical protein